MAEEWYREGLRFTCTGCGNCCTGEPGYVWVNQAEIDALAKRMGMTPEAFEERYVRKEGARRSLIEYKNGDCVFFDNQTRHCTVYSDRPRQCKTWPFWKSNLTDKAEWDYVCSICPGSGQGELIPLQEIKKRVNEVIL